MNTDATAGAVAEMPTTTTMNVGVVIGMVLSMSTDMGLQTPTTTTMNIGAVTNPVDLNLSHMMCMNASMDMAPHLPTTTEMNIGAVTCAVLVMVADQEGSPISALNLNSWKSLNSMRN